MPPHPTEQSTNSTLTYIYTNTQNEARKYTQAMVLESAGLKRVRPGDDADDEPRPAGRGRGARSAQDDPDYALLNTTAADAAWKNRKRRRAGSKAGGTKDGWSCFDEDCQHRAFAARMARLERTRRRRGEDAADEYAAQTQALGAALNTDIDDTPEAVLAAAAARQSGTAHSERMAAELVDMVGRRSQFSRPRKNGRAGSAGQSALDGGVNERNKRFNAKVARAYEGAEESASAEIRQSLERGTAL